MIFLFSVDPVVFVFAFTLFLITLFFIHEEMFFVVIVQIIRGKFVFKGFSEKCTCFFKCIGARSATFFAKKTVFQREKQKLDASWFVSTKKQKKTLKLFLKKRFMFFALPFKKLEVLPFSPILQT